MDYIPIFRSLALFFIINIQVTWGMIGSPISEENYSISGYVIDASNGEALFGASLYVREIKGGTSTNSYGFYSITLEKGTYMIECRYVGFETQVLEVDLSENRKLNIELEESNRQLKEVIILGQIDQTNIEQNEISLNRLHIKTINAIPAFLGETDILNSIQLLPGVTRVGEGTSGFNVRGGGAGQNLILMDEAPVFNSSHLLGFFSIFNPDAVRDVQLYKGGMPARYGGRTSSILDVKLKEGNNRQFSIRGGIGTIFSRVALEAPIIKGKSSFIIAGRRSYIDLLAKPFVDQLDSESQFYFYDLSLNAHYDFNEKNKIFLTGYVGRDVFQVNDVQGIKWGSRLASIRWNHLFTKKLFSNFNVTYSEYKYGLAFFDDLVDRLEWNSSLQVGTFKPQFTYFLSINNLIEFGGEINYYKISPANGLVVSNYDSVNVRIPDRYALEWSLFVSNDQWLGPKFNLRYGIRTTTYHLMGPGSIYEYQTLVQGKRKIFQSQKYINERESIQKYFNLEPRLSLNYHLSTRKSLKASYIRITQNIHLISNTSASTPVDIWIPGTNNIQPEIADQIGLGYSQNLETINNISASVEAFYRSTQNVVDYIDGAQIYVNEYIEAELLSGKGRSYGLEFYVEKTSGFFQGWLSYTIGRSEYKVPGINHGKWYPARFDQLHNLKIAGFYKLNERWSFSSTFTFLTGTPTTFPTTRLDIQDYIIPYNYYGDRNNKRIPNYHRLDISVILNSKEQNKKGEKKKYRDYWVFGLYNLYARENPFSVYFSQGTERPSLQGPVPTFATQMSVIGTIVPGISYNFKF